VSSPTIIESPERTRAAQRRMVPGKTARSMRGVAAGLAGQAIGHDRVLKSVVDRELIGTLTRRFSRRGHPGWWPRRIVGNEDRHHPGFGTRPPQPTPDLVGLGEALLALHSEMPRRYLVAGFTRMVERLVHRPPGPRTRGLPVLFRTAGSWSRDVPMKTCV